MAVCASSPVTSHQPAVSLVVSLWLWAGGPGSALGYDALLLFNVQFMSFSGIIRRAHLRKHVISKTHCA